MLRSDYPRLPSSSAFSRKTILIVSSVVAFCSTIGLVLGYYTGHMMSELMAGRIHEFPKGYAVVNYLAFMLRPMTYEISRTYWTHILGERLNFLDHLPALILMLYICGLIFFALGKNAGIRLLRFAYSTWLIFRAFALISFLIYQAMLPVKLEYYELKRDPWYILLLVIFVNALWIAMSAWMLSALRSLTRTKLQDEEGTQVFVPAGRWVRFLHMQIDGWLMILILLSFVSTFLWLMREKVGAGADISAWKFLIYLTIFVIQFVYYAFLESCWGITPGKSLTGTAVNNDKGECANWRAILSRTLSRFIPFDNFSFFGRRGWHDSLSNTWVCKEETKPVEN